MAISVLARYQADWEKLLKSGEVMIDGRTSRYFAKVLSANGYEGKYTAFRNPRMKRTMFRFDRKIKTMPRRLGIRKIAYFL